MFTKGQFVQTEYGIGEIVEEVGDIYRVWVEDEKEWTMWGKKDLTPLKGLNDLRVGDRIDSIYGEKKILRRVNNLILLGYANDDKVSGWYTISELKNKGYKITNRDTQEEMIKVDGKKYSESTVKEALKEHLK